jgi:hypothetical protein
LSPPTWETSRITEGITARAHEPIIFTYEQKGNVPFSHEEKFNFNVPSGWPRSLKVEVIQDPYPQGWLRTEPEYIGSLKLATFGMGTFVFPFERSEGGMIFYDEFSTLPGDLNSDITELYSYNREAGATLYIESNKLGKNGLYGWGFREIKEATITVKISFED